MKKNISRYFNLIIGCLLIALSLYFFIIPNGIINFGFSGISTFINYVNGVKVSINLLLLNLIFILLSVVFIDKKIIKVYLLPSILIPVFLFILETLPITYSIDLPEFLLVVIVSGFLSGTGYSMIYKEGYSAGVSLLVEEVICKKTRFHSKLYSWVLDIIVLIIFAIYFGYEIALYSLITIIITRYMVTKARFGINDSKLFYIITTKEHEIKYYITHDLKGELSVLDSKGGYTNKHYQILISLIPTAEYYKLKEGIRVIDPKAFIAITDTYDVVNRKTF